MTVYIEVDRIMRAEDMEKAWKCFEEQGHDKVVLLPAGCHLAQPKVLYECDRRACETCGDECHLTSDIAHAVNFKQTPGGIFEEKRGEGNGPV